MSHFFKVTTISQGFDFGHGSISAKYEKPDILALVEQTIHTASTILVPIDVNDNGEIIDDDGCGDGRGVLTVFSADRIFKRSLNRCKVFGGSATMTAAIKIGVGQAGTTPLNEVFVNAVETLVRKKIDFGAHTDEQAAGNKCGCGAIDRAPEIILATMKYKEPIRKVIHELGVDTRGLEEAFGNFGAYVSVIAQHPEYSGKKVADTIIQKGKVVKLLGGAHKERRIVLNQVRNFTVNQTLIREVTADHAQIFAVDVWRLHDLAAGLFDGQPALQNQAFLSELIYTLATAAVLTKGDLPVDMIETDQSMRVPA